MHNRASLQEGAFHQLRLCSLTFSKTHKLEERSHEGFEIFKGEGMSALPAPFQQG